MFFAVATSAFCLLQKIYLEGVATDSHYRHGAIQCYLHAAGGHLRPHDTVGDEKVPTEALSTHVRYFVPLTVEEYIYMVDKEKAPTISTIDATVRMPIYDRVNGLLEHNHCLPFLTYMFTNQSLFTDSRDTFYIVEVYISQHTLHAQVEAQRMCLFSRDHLSPTLSFDYTYEFTEQERSLQRVYRGTLKDNSSLATHLCLYNFCLALLGSL